MKQPVSYLKRLVKSRAGRIAELQMEIKILEGIIDRKVREGDLGGSAPRTSAPAQMAKAETAAPKSASEVKPEPAIQPGTAPQQALETKPAQEASSEQASAADQTKITQKSSNHAFEEID